MDAIQAALFFYDALVVIRLYINIFDTRTNKLIVIQCSYDANIFQKALRFGKVGLNVAIECQWEKFSIWHKVVNQLN